MFPFYYFKRFARMVFDNKPDAYAIMTGGGETPALHGIVNFYQVKAGTLVVAEVFNLPQEFRGKKEKGIYGFHIHEGLMCLYGNEKNPFEETKGHLNPGNQPHPEHAGDMPPLFGNGGYAYLTFFTNRFQVNEILGKTVVIHSDPDDFTTQPAGNSGVKIACGVIE